MFTFCIPIARSRDTNINRSRVLKTTKLGFPFLGVARRKENPVDPKS